MKHAWKKRLFITAIVILALVSFALATSTLKRPSSRLANGTVLYLLAVTHGPTNTIIPGGMWDKLIYRFAPSKGIRLGPLKLGPVSVMQDQWRLSDGTTAFPHKAVVWIGHAGPSNSLPLPVPDGKWFSDIRATLADERGEEWEMRSGTSHPRSTSAHGLQWVSPWDFTSFPRRGKTLRFRMYALNNSQEWDTLADFKFPNPTLGPYPVWQSSNLPVTRTNGDLEVSLVELISGTKAIQYYPGTNRPFTKATFEVKQDGHLTKSWLPDRVEATDATGNEPWVPMVNYHLTNHLAVYEIQATSLSPSEVWRLRVRFVKERFGGESDPAHEQVWTSPEFAVLDGGVLPVKLTTNWQAGTLTFETSESPFPKTLRLELNPLPKDTRLRVIEFIDDQGRKVEYQSGGFSDMGFDAQWKIPTGAKWIRVTVGLIETRTLEFVAQPTRQ